ncbi:hypothetical protein [Longirhabdus pacifica]|uniref:hypothetical protein n=1 Tax=Longirhabdus pacifica TaxID=2305227 RepID=UPI001009319D|nr:hypothetical protein [Longirhabdus pacifica]
MDRNWMKVCSVCMLLLVMLTGCLYPQDQSNNQEGLAYVPVVQSAIDMYQEQTGLLPIKNSELDTPLYEKYIVDFAKLKQRNILADIPPNAFEQGGIYYYVLIDVETTPTVKLLNLQLTQQVNEVQREVKLYAIDTNKLPYGESISQSWYEINYDLLGIDPVTVPSLYGAYENKLMLHESGIVYIDYAQDIMREIQNIQNWDSISNDLDLRTYLIENYPYVPIKSYPYYWENDEPVVSDS